MTESIRRIIELGNQLTKGLSNLLDHQSYMRQREELHAESKLRHHMKGATMLEYKARGASLH